MHTHTYVYIYIHISFKKLSFKSFSSDCIWVCTCKHELLNWTAFQAAFYILGCRREQQTLSVRRQAAALHSSQLSSVSIGGPETTYCIKFSESVLDQTKRETFAAAHHTKKGGWQYSSSLQYLTILCKSDFLLCRHATQKDWHNSESTKLEMGMKHFHLLDGLQWEMDLGWTHPSLYFSLPVQVFFTFQPDSENMETVLLS